MPADNPACLLIHLEIGLPADMTVTGPGKWLACLLPILTHSLSHSVTRSLSQSGNRSTTRPALPVAYHLAAPTSRPTTAPATVLHPVLPANRPASLLLCLPIGLPACLPADKPACLLIHLQIGLPADMTVTGPAKWLACLRPIRHRARIARSYSQALPGRLILTYARAAVCVKGQPQAQQAWQAGRQIVENIECLMKNQKPNLCLVVSYSCSNQLWFATVPLDLCTHLAPR